MSRSALRTKWWPRCRYERRREALRQFLGEQAGPPAEQLLAVFDWLALTRATNGFRGCPFTNAAVELPDAGHPARVVISEYKCWLRGTFTELARQAGYRGLSASGTPCG
jgi:hypothetical protein